MDVSEHVDVAIVGAGVAGLAVAERLMASGTDVAVLEARDRVGGRLLSHDTDDGPLDLGATWYWHHEHRIVELIERLDLATFEQHLAGDAMYEDASRVLRVDGNPIDVPAGRFVDGAAGVAQALADRLPGGVVRLGATVLDIDGNGSDSLVVRTSAGSMRAGHVVVAVPPALASRTIDFRPGLDEPLAGLLSVTPVWMGATVKVVARYAHAFWRDAGLAGSAISHVGPMRELHDMSGPDGTRAAIFGFVPGRLGEPAPDRTELVDQLVRLFGHQAGEPIELVVQDWRAESATSPPEAERLTAYQTYGHDLFQRPALGGRLHWASTETSPEAPGHIEGALAAAERTVAAIATFRSSHHEPESSTP